MSKMKSTKTYTKSTIGFKLSLIAAVTLSACGGGGGGSTSPAPTSVACGTTAGATVQLSGTRQGVALNLCGTVSTFAGTGILGSSNGTGATATFDQPTKITTDGTNLYTTELRTNTIRKIGIATGAVTTLAGTAGVIGAADGIGAAASFYQPLGITTDGTNLYVVNYIAGTIRKIVIATGLVSTFATGISASAITTDGTNLFVTTTAHSIKKIVIATGVVTTIAGSASAASGFASGGIDGPGLTATFYRPEGITTDGINLYVTEAGNLKVRKIVIATGVVSTVAGSGAFGSLDGTGVAATFAGLSDITTDGTNLYVTESGSPTPRIRKIAIATGVVTTLPTTPAMGAVNGVTSDGVNLYVAGLLSAKIYKIQ